MTSRKKYDVIGIGSSMVDVLSIVDHFPDKEEVQKAENSFIEGGGPVATAIVTLARLGARTAMIDSLGNDRFGELILDGFKKEKVDTSFLKIHDGKTSSLSTILVRKSDGARTIIYSRGDAPEISPADYSDEIINKANFIHMSGRHFDSCIDIARKASKKENKISFDGGAGRFNERDKELIPMVNLCIVAKDYAWSYTNQPEMNAAGKMLLAEGPEIVVITDGINGSWLFTNEIRGYHQPAFIINETIDTTGCGDSYHGAFIFGLCRNFNLYETIKFASAVAALNSTKLGGRSGLPSYDEAVKFLENR